MKTLLKVFFFLVLTTLITNCKSQNKIDLTPIATVNNEVISKSFFDYSLTKLRLLKAPNSKKKEILENIISTILISQKATNEKLNKSKKFINLKKQNEIVIKKNFIIEKMKFKKDKFDNLYSLFDKEFKLEKNKINWKKVFVKQKRKTIVFGGEIPKRDESKISLKTDFINKNYTEKILINTPIINSSLYDLLKSFSDKTFYSLRDESIAGQKLMWKDILITFHLNNYILKNLKDDETKLLNEFLLRSTQDLLKQEYLQTIGFTFSDSSTTKKYTYHIAEQEALKFYKKNIEAFKEPQSITISHIRVKTQKLADKLRSKLKKNPEKFKEYAKKYSIAEDAMENGFLGTITKEDNVKLPLFKEFGFTLTKKNQISVAFKTKDGIEILKLHERKTKTLNFNENSTQRLISEMMQPLKREEKLKKIIKKLKKEAKIKFFLL